MKTIKLPLLALITSALMFTACKKEEFPTSSLSNEKKGSFTVKMTDAPGDYEALQIEIVKIEAYLENTGWITLQNSSQFINVLSLTNGENKY